MHFIKVDGPNEGQKYLSTALVEALNNTSSVVWLVSGGSNIEVACEIRRTLPADKLGSLVVALVDERYGKMGHPDSNFTKLQQAGFDFSGITFEPVLTGGNLSFEQATEDYQQRIAGLFEQADMIIGEFGIGSDGHTAGILPGSPATAIDDRLVIGYEGADFRRITLSFKAIGQVDEAYVFALGDDKLSALQSLHDGDHPLGDQPSQIFRQSGGKSFIINNMIGDRV